MAANPTTLDLNGTWQFQLDPDGALSHQSIQPDRTIAVPMPWQAALPELRQYEGYAFYRRVFTVDDAFLALGEARLHFGAVDYWCQVWLNDALVGEHEGGYTPFSFLVGTQLRAGENTVTLRVYDPVMSAIVNERWPNAAGRRDGALQQPFDARDVPHGKQEWYINVGGIWQNVWLEAVPRAFIAHVHVTPDIANSSASIRVQFGGDLSAVTGATVELSNASADGRHGSAQKHLAEGGGEQQATMRVPDARLWTLDDPHLYTLTATLTLPDGEQHSLSQRFGMRSFGYANGQFLLNGEPLFLLSALDQDLYPDTIYTPPSDEFLRDQFRKAKELGLNNLRCHIKPPDPRYLDLCDEMGLLVWAEIPSWRTFPTKGTLHGGSDPVPPEVRARVEQTLDAMIARDFNHPSLVIWTLVNEDWGTTLFFSPEDRQWVADLYDRCKRLDPTRLAVDNSACGGSWGPNFHVKSDIDDFHVYMSIPDSASSFATGVEQLALRPLWTYSGHGDTQRRGDEPLVLSEFGNWGLPSLAALRAHHGGEPPWFDLGPWWSRWEGEAGWPQGVEERFARLGLNAIWPDYEAFATATQWHQFESMKLEIEAMRRLPTLAGYVITEFTDAYWEANGLLDFARNPKAYHNNFKQVNNADVVLAFPTRRAFWADERARVPLYVSHYSGGAGDGAT
ncbi:MAG: glycoside hydrolase family 2, partial [Chloroflexales bacterium]|nr:glycoside hydrolase family 2 [Chloroflexales bacterium]